MYDLLLKKIFTSKGRSSRKEYFYKFIISLGFFILTSYTVEKCVEDNLFTVIYTTSICIIITIVIIQYFPLCIRRLHDLNTSGWYVLLTFAPFGQLLIFWLMFKKGTDGDNKYGSPPKH